MTFERLVDPKEPKQALTNPQWEKYAQLLAFGTPQHKAYVEAGFKANAGAASRLANKVNARVAQLLATTSKVAEQAVSAKQRFIKKGWEKLEASIAMIDPENSQAIKALGEIILAADKDQRVIEGGVSDRTDASSSVKTESVSYVHYLEQYRTRKPVQPSGDAPVLGVDASDEPSQPTQH